MTDVSFLCYPMILHTCLWGGTAQGKCVSSLDKQSRELWLHPLLLRQMSNTIWCFLAGGVDVFHVDIDQAKTVSHLKAEIKQQQPNLNDIAPTDLTLYRVEIESSHSTSQITTQLNQLIQNLNKGDALDARQTLSAAFGGSPPGKEYFALVHLPPSESIHSRACGVNTFEGMWCCC